jgi:hypothetical protein
MTSLLQVGVGGTRMSKAGSDKRKACGVVPDMSVHDMFVTLVTLTTEGVWISLALTSAHQVSD